MIFFKIQKYSVSKLEQLILMENSCFAVIAAFLDLREENSFFYIFSCKKMKKFLNEVFFTAVYIFLTTLPRSKFWKNVCWLKFRFLSEVRCKNPLLQTYPEKIFNQKSKFLLKLFIFRFGNDGQDGLLTPCITTYNQAICGYTIDSSLHYSFIGL